MGSGLPGSLPSYIHFILRTLYISWLIKIVVEITVHWPHFCRWQLRPMFIQSRMASSESHNIRTSSVLSVKRILSWIGHSRSFKVILIGVGVRNPELCCRNVRLMPTLFLKLTKIWHRENGKFVDFNDPTQVWRRPSMKRLRISRNSLYCQKLETLTYISATGSLGLCLLFFPQLFLKVKRSEVKTCWPKADLTWNSHSRSF